MGCPWQSDRNWSVPGVLSRWRKVAGEVMGWQEFLVSARVSGHVVHIVLGSSWPLCDDQERLSSVFQLARLQLGGLVDVLHPASGRVMFRPQFR